MNRNLTRVTFVVLPIVVVVVAVASACRGAMRIDISSPQIVHGKEVSAMEKLAARELWRCLARVSEKPGTIAADDGVVSDRAMIVLLDVAGNNRLAAEIEKQQKIAVDAATLGEDGFRWKATQCQGKPALLIAAAKPAGVMYGAYKLLEKLGFGFYLGGDTFPPAGSPLAISDSLDEVHKPVFAIRGTLPWGNLPNAYWDLDDWKFYFDQVSKQGYNFVGLHQYCSPVAVSGEPWCAYPWNGKLVGGAPMQDSMTVFGLKTEQFGFGTGDYYDRDPFTQRVTLEGTSPEDKIRRSQKMIAEAMTYAHTRGIKMCLGFGIGDDPTIKDFSERLDAMIGSLIKNYPLLDYVWFFQEESQGAAGWKVEKGSVQEKLVAANSGPFKYLSPPQRMAEGVRLNHVCQLAYRSVKKYRQDLPMIVSGWGYLDFTEYYLGLDKTLPKDVIFGALDSINPGASQQVSEVYGKLPPERGRWPIPWWNNDESIIGPQCTARPLVPLCRDVLKKKCQGMLGVHWLTHEVEEVAAYQGQFAWNPTLTYEGFYEGFAARCYGKPWAARMSRIHRDLESLGPRWTGAPGERDQGMRWNIQNRTGKKENRQKLREIHAELETIHKEMVAQKRLEGIERIEWLLTTIDWFTRYDDASLSLALDGPFGTLLKEAEAAQAKGDAAVAKQKAAAARDMMLKSGFREAIQTYPQKISAMSDFGEFTSIQGKCYVYYLGLWDRVKKVLGPVADDLGGPAVPAGTPPLLVGKTPNSVIEPSQNLVVNVVAISGSPIASCTLNYRTAGDVNWKQLPMAVSYRRTYTASIPSAEFKGFALEWHVEAMNQSKGVAHWPKGYPNVVWSASIRPAGHTSVVRPAGAAQEQ